MIHFLLPCCGHSCFLTHRQPRRRCRQRSHRRFLHSLRQVSLFQSSGRGVALARTLLPPLLRRLRLPPQPQPTRQVGLPPMRRRAYKRERNAVHLSVKTYLQATPFNSFVGSTPKQKELSNFNLPQFME